MSAEQSDEKSLTDQLRELESLYLESLNKVSAAEKALAGANAECLGVLQQLNPLQNQWFLTNNQKLAAQNRELQEAAKVSAPPRLENIEEHA